MRRNLIQMKKEVMGDIDAFSCFAGLFHSLPLPDWLYLKILFRRKMGYPLHLLHPQTFNEKLQWLKLYDRRPEYTRMADKYEVKEYVADLIGREHIIPTLGVWDSFDEIDFDKLPDCFVLKCTHDSGSVMVCRDRKAFDMDLAREKICRGLGKNYFYYGREWPYKDIKPRVLAEEYLEDSEEISGISYKGSSNMEQEGYRKGLKDYKFYCFNGKPGFIYVSQGLEDHATARINFLNMEWEKTDFQRADYKEFDTLPPKPACFQQMIGLAERLAGNIPFVRVDFYEVNKKVYFGEFTFSPGNGMTKLQPEEWDRKLGDFIVLPSAKNKGKRKR